MIKKNIHKNEINILEILQIFYKGKVKIAIVIIISIICASIINKLQPTPFVKAEITIEPLNRNQLLQFDLVNSQNIYDINRTVLYDNYVNLLEKRQAIKNAIKEFKIISRESYVNNQEYEEAVSIHSYKIAMSKSLIGRSFKIILHGSNKVQLLKLVKYIKKENNKLAVEKYISDFTHTISLRKRLEEVEGLKIMDQIKDIEIEFDLETKKIAQDLKFDIEDINTEIKNSLIEHKLRINKRIEYLSEQALIARKLQIPKTNMYIQNINSAVTTLGANNDGPLYLVGYEAIEEKIKIIKNRKNIELWANNERLLNIKRELSQNKNVERKELNKLFLDEVLILKKSLRRIDQNRSIIAISEEIFKENLELNDKKFESVNFEPYATKFETGQYTTFSKLLMIAVTFGIIISLIYLLLEEKILTNRRYRI